MIFYVYLCAFGMLTTNWWSETHSLRNWIVAVGEIQRVKQVQHPKMSPTCNVLSQLYKVYTKHSSWGQGHWDGEKTGGLGRWLDHMLVRSGGVVSSLKLEESTNWKLLVLKDRWHWLGLSRAGWTTPIKTKLSGDHHPIVWDGTQNII